MRLDRPRIPPIELDEADDEQQKLLAPLARPGGVLRIFRTLVRHPKLFKRWMVFGAHVLSKSTLPAREREIAILRVGWLRQAEYEWAQHVEIGLDVGLSETEIERIALGPDADGWGELDALLLRATDELVEDAFIEDGTWAGLSGHLSQDQIMDLIFAVGQYNLVSMALNSLGVQLEDGARRFPKLG